MGCIAHSKQPLHRAKEENLLVILKNTKGAELAPLFIVDHYFFVGRSQP